jgi:hypothetical protein
MVADFGWTKFSNQWELMNCAKNNSLGTPVWQETGEGDEMTRTSKRVLGRSGEDQHVH